MPVYVGLPLNTTRFFLSNGLLGLPYIIILYTNNEVRTNKLFDIIKGWFDVLCLHENGETTTTESGSRAGNTFCPFTLLF